MKSLITKGTVLILSMAVFTACSEQNQVTRKAPQHESELGHLVLGAQPGEKEKYLSDNPAAQIRILSEKHGFYEIRFDDMESIRNYFPSSSIEKNEFYLKQQSTNPIDELTADFENGNFAQVQNKLQQLKNKSLQVLGHAIDIQTCKRNGLKPILKIIPISDNLKRSQSLEVGEEVTIDASQSQPHAFTGGDLKLSFVVSAPLGSDSEKIFEEKTLNLSLDTMGVYQIMIIAQDVKDVCQIQSAKLSVTGNEPFLPYAVAKDRSISTQSFLAKLGVQKAHEKTTGKGILIAVIDSGVNYNHPHLAENIFINTNETDNGQDNDDNGYIGDRHGWDFVNDDPYPFDDNGHGSHVAGLSAGKLLGVAPDARILPIKISNPEGLSDLGTTLQGIVYALDMGAKVLNLSFGNYRPSVAVESRILRLAEQADALLMASAGNGDPNTGMGLNTDVITHMPSGLHSANLLSVGALNEFDSLAYYSNYGQKSVHIATYGGEDFDVHNRRPYDGMLYSAYIPNPKGLLFHPAQGTSMSAPIASGIAALVMSFNPNLTAPEIAQILKQAGPTASALNGKVNSGKVLTADSAIELASQSMKLASQP